jgi:hypothetical protein
MWACEYVRRITVSSWPVELGDDVIGYALIAHEGDCGVPGGVEGGLERLSPARVSI